ncbi:MAG TPA: hypothetical protein DCS87_04850 [Rheinheimera sp.]|nr:hypothetical protein [Rheinheimera sp.]
MQVLLVIEDDGAGFPEGISPKAFSQFDSSASTGFGLGLYIVNQVVAWHQGQMQIGRSHVLGGAAVTLVLPAAPPH